MRLVQIVQGHAYEALMHCSAGIQNALDRCPGESSLHYIAEQLESGNMSLLAVTDGGRYKMWAVVRVDDMPNFKALHIYAITGVGVSAEMLGLLSEYARAIGCSEIRCAANGAAERMYKRVGMEAIYSIMRVKL